MNTLALLVGIFILVVSMVGVVVPDAVLMVARSAATPVGLYIAGLVRVAIGLVLFAVAPSSRYPVALGALAVTIFFAGLFTPVIGVARAHAVIDWWAAQGPAVMRLWCLVGVGIGFFVAFTTRDGHRMAVRRARRATVRP